MNDTQVTTGAVTEPVPYEDVVGQPAAKKTLTHMIGCYKYSKYFPTTLFVAAKGQGKTTMAYETAKHLCRFNELNLPDLNAATGKPRIKPLVKVNCASMGGVKGFINGIVIPHIQDKEVTVLFDEASEIPHKVSMAMLDIFNSDLDKSNYQTTFQVDEYVCDFDFKRQTFLFCTSEPNKVFHALKNRFKQISLEDYTKPELSEIFRRNLKGVEFENGILDEIASVVRGNARNAYQLAMDAKEYLKGSDCFMAEDWSALKDIYNIKPLGLNPLEIQILRYLAEHSDGTSLTRLSAKTGMTREALQKDVELYLMKHDLMSIETTGRQITTRGQDYLKALGSNCGPTPQAATA